MKKEGILNKKIIYIWLTKLKISNSIKLKILEKIGGVERLYNSSLDDLIYFNFNNVLISKILNKDIKKNLDKEYQYMLENNIDIIGIEDEFYPKKFKEISDKPIAFYIRGNKKILNMNSVGIIGSRNALRDSLSVAKRLSYEISKMDINIISGLARGIDKFAHLGALENKNGKTIAVLGAGIDNDSIYPYENKRVFERILENDGAIISEYPLKTKPYSYNFPYRNRIISAISDAVVVVEASKKSGSLITVDYALEQGKDVYVCKSKNMDSKNFEGNKILIEQGAKIIDGLF